MKNHKIVFANQKGGVGKSTLCMLFANYLAWKKQDVCIIDTDLQKTIMMQRKKDREIYDDMEEPYTVQDFDVQDPELMQQLMESASQTEGFVLFDSPGNVSEDGLVPMFTGADFIICPYEYEEKTLDSTGTFIQVINALRQATPEMTARLFFVPNRIDVRIGTADELRMWKQTDAIFKQLGAVTPRITARASLKRINTFEITASQRDAVKGAFDFMIRRMKEA
ncbi:MAG: ParA family protein [Prevotella sp.]|nr:ParA family protein [Prevotella sp.]